MGAFGGNFGSNFAAQFLSVVPTKTTTAELCVNISVTEDLCV